GIRDRTVTGVQTCALPIYVSTSSIAAITSHASLTQRVLVIMLRRLRSDRAPTATSTMTAAAVATTVRRSALIISGFQQLANAIEIGRASCRERVGGEGAAV